MTSLSANSMFNDVTIDDVMSVAAIVVATGSEMTGVETRKT